MGDHTESIQIDYDPGQTSYEALLEVFWSSHNPGRRVWSRQYMAAVFYHNDEQKDLAMETRDRLLPQVTGKIFSRKGKIQTKILPTSEFYLAEDYHQKYLLRKTPLLIKEFAAIYPSTSDLVNSTAAARVNGYVGGYGTEAMLQAEIDGLGLSPAGRQKLLEIVRRFNR